MKKTAGWNLYSAQWLGTEARKVAQLFGIPNPGLEFIAESENRIWRVTDRERRYVLRCHRPAVSPELACLPQLGPEEIAAELQWVAGLVLPEYSRVPMPHRTADREFVVSRQTPDGNMLHWSMLHWMPGRKLLRGFSAAHMVSAGRLMAQLHNLSQKAGGFPGRKRPRYDLERLQHAIDQLKPARRRGLLNSKTWTAIEAMQAGVTFSTHNLGEGPQHFGLIHADLTPHNILFHDLDTGLIDFSSCGYGHYGFDIAQLFTMAPGPEYLEAFETGYNFVRPLDEHGWLLARSFCGMSFILWLNFNLPTEFKRIRMRIDEIADRIMYIMMN